MTASEEEPVDETADAARLGNRPAGLFTYRLLTDTDRSALRLDRAHHLEAELYRLELAYEESLDNADREDLAHRAELLLRRLQVHLSALAGSIPADLPATTPTADRTNDPAAPRARC